MLPYYFVIPSLQNDSRSIDVHGHSHPVLRSFIEGGFVSLGRQLARTRVQVRQCYREIVAHN